MLSRLLGLRAEDRRDTGVAFATLVLMLAAHALLETARDALFLDKLPASDLPAAYIAIAALALLVNRVNQAATARFSRRKLLSLSLAGGGAVTAAFWALTSTLQAWILGALYVWTGLLATIVIVQFWLQLGDVLDVSQAKRLFSLIAAGGLVGATLGSGLATALIPWLGGARPLLLVSAVLFVGAAVVPMGFRRTAPLEAKRRAAAPPPKSGLDVVRGNPYLVRLFWVALVGAVLATVVDYTFKAEVVLAARAGGWDLGLFFARFYAVLNLVALVVQVVVAPRLLRVLGVNRALLVMPALLLLSSAGFALSLGLIPVLLLKSTDGALRHSVHRTASEILFLPLPRKLRERFKAFAEAAGQRGGQAVASLLLLAAAAMGGDQRVNAVALVGLTLVWIAAMVGLEPHYVDLFRKQLREGSLDTEIDVPGLDLASFELLVSALSAEDDTEVLAALDLFEGYGKTDRVPALVLYHPSRAIVLRAFEMFGKSQRRDVLRLTERLLKHDDEEIRAAALQTLAGAKPDEALLRSQLEDGSPAVRCTALVALIANGFVDDAEAQRTLQRMARGDCGDTRRALARSLRHLREDRFAWVLEELAQSDDPRLLAEVAESLALAPNERFIPQLVSMLAKREPRAAARRALVALGSTALDALADAIRDVDLAPSLRKHLPRTISRFPGLRAGQVLLAALTHERDAGVQFKILRGLGRMRAERPDLSVDKKELLGLATTTLEEAVQYLSWRLGMGRVVAHRQEVLTPATELLTALLDEKERDALMRVFRLLHILEPSQEFRMIYDGLKSGDPRTKASSRELLSHVVPSPLKEGILAMADSESPRARLKDAVAFFDPRGREQLDAALFAAKRDEQDGNALLDLSAAYQAMLRDMLADKSGALRDLASYHVAELGLEELRADVESAAMSSRTPLAEVSKSALDLFDVPSTPFPRGPVPRWPAPRGA